MFKESYQECKSSAKVEDAIDLRDSTNQNLERKDQVS